MGLNIKNPEAHVLAKKLARLAGESLTIAVTTAIRERLDRIERNREESLANRLLVIGKDCATHFKEPYRSLDHGDLLYGKRGLPR